MGRKQPQEQPHAELPPEQPQPVTEHELIGDIKRLQADFENYKKRVERDKEMHKQLANEQLIRELLPIMDNLQLVLDHTHTGTDDLAQGVRMTLAQLEALFETYGITHIPTEGAFNPHQHEAIETVESLEHPHGSIIKTHQRGYTLAGKVLRPARVSVTKRTKESS